MCAAGIHETMGAAGRRQGWFVDPLSNFMVQDPDQFVATGSNAAVLGTPFVIELTKSAETSSAQFTETMYTVPTGYKLRVLDAWVLCLAAEASAAVTIKSGTNAITDAIVAAVDKVITRAGTIDDGFYEIAAAGTLVAVSSGGTNGPACKVGVLACLIPV